MSDLEMTVSMFIRRGTIRSLMVTASAPGDNADVTSPIYVNDIRPFDNVVELIERAFIESAVLWRQPWANSLGLVTRRFRASDLLR